MNCSTILVISDDAEFSRSLQGRWQAESPYPAFIVVKPDLYAGINAGSFDLAIVGRVTAQAASEVLNRLKATSKPVIFVHKADSKPSAVRQSDGLGMRIPDGEGWLDATVLIGSHVLLCAAVMTRAGVVEQQNAELERQAALGRYTIEMRHSLNNALTSILGNAELLLLNTDTLGPQACSQIETVRNMALRIHEFLQRFTSIEKEMTVAENAGSRRMSCSTAAGMALSH